MRHFLQGLRHFLVSRLSAEHLAGVGSGKETMTWMKGTQKKIESFLDYLEELIKWSNGKCDFDKWHFRSFGAWQFCKVTSSTEKNHLDSHWPIITISIKAKTEKMNHI